MFLVAEKLFFIFFVCCCFSQKLDISLTYQSIKNNKVMTTILNKLNWYKSKDEAFANEPGDNFFFVNGLWTCISENDAIFLEMLDAGYKTEMQIYLEKIANK